MSNRQQRRKRQQQNARKKEQRKARAQMVARRFLFPSDDEPLIEVHIEEEVPASVKETCLKYWAFTRPGEWTHKVADLGSTAQVSRTVKDACHASVLTLLCPQCDSPVTARTRSDLATWRVWHTDNFPRQEQAARFPCDQCHEAAARTRQRVEHEQAEERRRCEARVEHERRTAEADRVAAANAWLVRHADRPAPEELPEPAEALTLLTMIDIMMRKDVQVFGPLDVTDYQFGTSRSADAAALKSLYQRRWIAPTTPATTGDFVYRDDRTVEAVYLNQVPWRLSHALGAEAPQGCPEIADHLRLHLLDSPQDLAALSEDLDVLTAVTYLNDLLVTKYEEEPVPEHRLQDAHEYLRKALRSGFTFGQLLAVAWSAAASSVAWGQRTRGLRPGSVSSAAVTNLERRLGFAKDRKVPEYDLPHWVTPPANRATVSRLLEQHQAESRALDRFQTLQQRIASRETEAWELDGDLAEATDSQESTDTPLRADKTALTYALVNPDGSLDFRTGTEAGMKLELGQTGDGLVDRILMQGPTHVQAYVAELVPRNSSTTNDIARSMLRLLGWPTEAIYGPIALFSVRPQTHRVHSLDEDQQEMLHAAHSVAQARAATPQS